MRHYGKGLALGIMAWVFVEDAWHLVFAPDLWIITLYVTSILVDGFAIWAVATMRADNKGS